MEFSIATLLSHFSEDKLVAGKVLEKKLACEDTQSIEKLQIALDILEKIGILSKERGKYRRIYEDDVVEAKLRCSSKGFCFAIQNIEDADDIYIRESHLSNAWNGDRVLVKIIKEGTRRRSPEGEVKLILERANPSLLATVKQNNGDFSAVPLDDRLLFELFLKRNGNNLEQAIDHLVHVEVLRYPIGALPPIGKIKRILGSDAEEAADTDIICSKHDLPIAFPEDVIKAATKIKPNFDTTENENRQDLRHLLTLAIEAESDRGDIPFIENAFTLEKTETGQWQLGVHITDVARYVETDSPLDLEAKKRGTAIYLGDKLLPLFPEEITVACSLLPGRDRSAVSVFLTFESFDEPDKGTGGQVVEFEILPSLINVDHLLSYSQVQTIMLSSPEEVEPEMVRVKQMLENLFMSDNPLSPLVKAERLKRGGFEITVDRTQSTYKDESRLGAILVASYEPVRSLLCELVILVGKVVAEHLSALQVPGIYCTQPDPDWEELEDLLKLGANLGLNLKLESEEEIRPQDYQNLTQEFSKSSANKILNYLLQSTLRQVRYITHPGSHFGLAYTDGYTHCVSPGQRYVDLFIQRVLKAVFEQGRDRKSVRVKKSVNLNSSSCHGEINWNVLPPQLHNQLNDRSHAIVSHLNDRDKLAEDAERDLQGLKKAEKMKERTGEVFPGLITGVQSYGFFVEIEDLLVEGLVHVSSLKDDWYEYRSRHSCLVGRKNGIAYRLGDRVQVEVKSVDYYRQQIDLVTVGGGSAASTEDWED
ncbi:MAG: ribonuclease R [Prochloraceae cyanobacterium]|nr:ribonuclease R [Prochloraceae cyanobacterium]